MNEPEFIIPCADRVANLPPYVFATVFKMKEDALAAGREVIDLGVGNPDGRAPDEVITALNEALTDTSWNCHGYGTFKGRPEFRQAIADWYRSRFEVAWNADTEVLPLIGSKEGLANLMRAYLNARDTVIIPSPCYPAYFGAARLCEAEIFEPPLTEENGFVLDFESIPAQVADRSRMLILNYPHNPTGGVCDLGFYREAVAWCKEHAEQEPQPGRMAGGIRRGRARGHRQPGPGQEQRRFLAVRGHPDGGGPSPDRGTENLRRQPDSLRPPR
jgi:LL-diaminopimelate aminotransferase